ncbi:MAG: DnaD domain protein [Clostridia bacterium]|nr:DnaD domain protein [Clostridia bacterium]
MSFCSFSKETITNSSTVLDNRFISTYLPEANGDAIKIYIYGLFVCQESDSDISFDKFCNDVKLDKDVVSDCFRFWEELGIVNVLSEDPFIVKYLPVAQSKPRKYSAEKYGEFNKALQVLIPERMITTNEYAAYFSLMEENGLKPEALLMIVKYCVDLKGGAIGLRYILKVANDFIARGITTTTKIEKELSDYSLKTGEFASLMNYILPNKKPQIEDLKLFEKWNKQLLYDIDTIIFIAKSAKIKNIEKLDKEIDVLYASKKFSEKEIADYYKSKAKTTELAYAINRSLSVYTEVIDPVIENYVIPWQNMGYDEETLLFLATYCFKKNRRSLEEMNDVVEKLYKNGLITLTSIAEYLKSISADDDFIKKLLLIAGLSRKPTEWDRANLKTWRSWNFSDEMISEACAIAAGKSNPMSYVNAVLSGWKSEGIFTADKIRRTDKKVNPQAIQTRNYTKEEFDKLIDDIDEIEF